MSNLWLFIAMVIIGILYTALSHFIAMPLFNNIIAHCIILGAMFGLTNFTVSILFFKRLGKLKELNRQLRLNLMTDNLTGLLNRRAFDHDIKQVGHSEMYSVIFIDIDNFRDFNNHFGHDIGDNVLKKVGDTIKACVRGTDRVYNMVGRK